MQASVRQVRVGDRETNDLINIIIVSKQDSTVAQSPHFAAGV